MTLLEVLQAAAVYLTQQGIDEPRRNAEYLLAHVLQKKRLDLYLEFDRVLSEKERADLRMLVRSRIQGVPLQHLLGTACFFGRDFICDARALIPRPETEQLVEAVLTDLKTLKWLAPQLLDVGTGSGCIMITLLLEDSTAQGVAIDCSAAALSLAQENAKAFDVESRLTFFQNDLFPPQIPSTLKTFDYIIANLPYIPNDEIAQLSPEVQHDPLLALQGGKDGLTLIQRFIPQACAYLNPGGRLALEIGTGQASAVMNCLLAHHYHNIQCSRDYQGVERFLFAGYG